MKIDYRWSIYDFNHSYQEFRRGRFINSLREAIRSYQPPYDLEEVEMLERVLYRLRHPKQSKYQPSIHSTMPPEATEKAVGAFKLTLGIQVA